MHPCIPHLPADIAAVHLIEIPGEKLPQTIEEHFEEIDKWVSDEESKLISEKRLNSVDSGFHRYLYQQVQWDKPLIAASGLSFAAFGQ